MLTNACRVIVTHVRGGPSSGGVQLAELTFFGASGKPVEVASSQNALGSSPVGTEVANVHDGDVSTKWVDVQKGEEVGKRKW